MTKYLITEHAHSPRRGKRVPVAGPNLCYCFSYFRYVSGPIGGYGEHDGETVTVTVFHGRDGGPAEVVITDNDDTEVHYILAEPYDVAVGKLSNLAVLREIKHGEWVHPFVVARRC